MAYPERYLRPRRRAPWDESLPDGTPAMEVGLRGTRLGGLLNRVRPAVSAEEPVAPEPLPPARPIRAPYPVAPIRPARASDVVFDDSGLELPPPPATVVGNIGAPPLTTTDRRGRPRIVPGVPEADTLTAERELSEQLRTYEPKKRSKLRLIGLSALRGLAAGPGGALTGALWGGLASVVDPTIEDRVWREREMEQSAARQQGLIQQQRIGLQDELLGAQVDETRAQAEQRRNPRPKLVEAVLPDGTQVLVPEEQGVVTGRPRPGASRIAVDVPGVGPIEATPEAALGYYGQVATREGQTTERDTKRREEAAMRGSQRQAKLTEYQTLYSKAQNAEDNAKALDTHIANWEQGMATMPEGTASVAELDAKGNRVTRTYPSLRTPYERGIAELKEEQQRLRRQAQEWRVQGDKAKAEAEAIPEIASTPAPSPQWSASRWAKANKGGDVEAAKKAAKDAGYEVVP